MASGRQQLDFPCRESPVPVRRLNVRPKDASRRLGRLIFPKTFASDSDFNYDSGRRGRHRGDPDVLDH
jgi:hypothetical protein